MRERNYVSRKHVQLTGKMSNDEQNMRNENNTRKYSKTTWVRYFTRSKKDLEQVNIYKQLDTFEK